MTENVQPTKNPLLEAIRMPGKTFKLPSGGLFYTNGELANDVKNGEVRVYPMRGIDEIKIKTPDMLLNGTAVEEVFAHCIPQVVKPMDLFAKDVDFLLVCIREISYGPEVEVRYKHDCKDAKEHGYAVNISSFIQHAKSIDPTTTNETFSMTLENGQRVELRPTRYRDVLDMFNAADGDLSPDTIHKNLVRVLSSMIVKVDNVDNTDLINEWLSEIKAGWIKDISKALERTGDWGASFDTHTTCKDCGGEIIITTTLNPVSFFT